MSVGHLDLRIDQISVDADLSDAQAERLSPVLRFAFEDLARRLQSSPVARLNSPSQLAISELHVDAVSVDELLGPRGAARLADVFWQRLIASRGER